MGRPDGDARGVSEAADDELWRVAAYAVCRRDGDVLLVRASDRTEVAGSWFLPGGGLHFGEDPSVAVLRELTEETGLVAHDPKLVGVLVDERRRDSEQTTVCSVRIVYVVDVEDDRRELVSEHDGTSDEARWVAPLDFEKLNVTPYVLRALELAEEK